jgi:signal transduction histidine kinase
MAIPPLHSRWEGLLSNKQRVRFAVFYLSLITIACLSHDVFAYQDISKKRVLILHSYYQGYKWTDDENAGIESVLKPVIGRNNLHIEYMDTKKVFGDLYSQRLYEVYKLKYKNYKFDLIITTDNNAFEFMLKYRDKLFPGTPVVFCGVNYFEKDKLKDHKEFTGVNEENDFIRNIELTLKLHPKTKQIVFINEWTATGVGVHEAFVEAMAPFQNSIKFILLEDVELEDIFQQLKSLPPDSIVVYTAFSRDRSGRLFEYSEIMSMIARESKVPIYSPYDFNFGYGAVGGLAVLGYDQGETAGRMALRILNGEKVENIPVMMTAPKRYMFDYEQLQRFSIAMSTLPKDSTIINLPQTLYFKYKKWVDAIIVTIIVLLLTISILLINIQKRRQTEKALTNSQEDLRTLAWRLAEAEETERKMLSRELHDEIGQNLTILGVNLNLLRSLIPKDSVEMIHSRINDSLVIVKQTTERIRNLMSNLRSPVLDDYGLVAAIDLYGKQWSSRTGIDIIVRGPETDTHLLAHMENAIFRIVQESLTNVVKHAKASQVIITFGVTQGKVYLSVEDNGIGYDVSRLTGDKGERGWGLVTMSERALAVGGACRVQSQPGLGTHVLVEVPI